MLDAAEQIHVNDRRKQPVVYIFNPDNDLALAHEAMMSRRGLPRAVYTPKPRAEQLARSLALLPAWYAAPDSSVLAPVGSDVEGLQQWLNRHLDGITVTDRVPREPATLRPWGWSNTLISKLLSQGASPLSIPSNTQRLAQLSSRQLTMTVHERLAAALGHTLCPMPTVLSSLDEVKHFITSHQSGCYFKKLWSGSGRGIYHTREASATRELLQWTGGEIARCGAVMGEPTFERIMDMAVEFECRDGKVTIAGYSIFHVDSHDRWQGNIVDKKDNLHERITTRYGDFDKVVAALSGIIADIVPVDYNGHLGVDMLLFREGENIGIDPCVEVNMRCTMGLVAAMLGERCNLHGRLHIVPREEITASDTAVTPPDNHFVAVVSPL